MKRAISRKSLDCLREKPDNTTEPVDSEVYDALDDLTELWFDFAEERALRFPLTVIIIGPNGQYICISMRGGRKQQAYRVRGASQARFLLGQLPRAVVLIDAGDKAVELTPQGGSETDPVQ